MQPNMAQVLNTLAHEIRTPLAISQGYLKLYADGRLTTPDDQHRALQQTREALGVIATLCADICKVGALSEAGSPVLAGRMDVAALAREIKTSGDLAGATWTGSTSPAQVATYAPRDLARSIAVMAKAAFDEEKGAPHVIDMAGDREWLVIRAGAAGAVDALRQGPDAAGAAAFNVVRGGKGMTLILATFVLQQHRIQTWSHQDHKASVGLRIPLVTV